MRKGVTPTQRNQARYVSLLWTRKPMSGRGLITEGRLKKRYDTETAKFAKSFTFIPSKLSDNKILLDKNPGYKANLKMQCKIDRARLLMGDWKIKATPGIYFRRADFEEVESFPVLERIVRFWDLAATEDKKRSTS